MHAFAFAGRTHTDPLKSCMITSVYTCTSRKYTPSAFPLSPGYRISEGTTSLISVPCTVSLNGRRTYPPGLRVFRSVTKPTVPHPLPHVMLHRVQTQDLCNRSMIALTPHCPASFMSVHMSVHISSLFFSALARSGIHNTRHSRYATRNKPSAFTIAVPNDISSSCATARPLLGLP